MPTVDIDGIETHYEVLGDGPPLLMFSPGGFNAIVDNWRDLGVYRRIKPLDHLPQRYRCLGIDRAHLMGACVGCSSVAAFTVAQPERVRSMVLYSPAGGPRYRITNHSRFGQHLAYVQEHGLDGVLELARTHEHGFSKDPRVGPWVSQLRRDQGFARRYVAQDVARYVLMVGATARTLFDRDTVPGAEPEDLLRLDVPALVVPGQDASHATSAARYLEECLPDVEYWDVPVAEQSEQNAPARIMEFLDRY
jgi:pimeloyl-ACP methyl ester carboxylesterase